MYILYLEGWGTFYSCSGVRLGVRCVSAGNSFVELLHVLCLLVNNVNSLVKQEKVQLFLVVGQYCCHFLHCERFFGNIVEIRWLLCCYTIIFLAIFQWLNFCLGGLLPGETIWSLSKVAQLWAVHSTDYLSWHFSGEKVCDCLKN